MSEPLLERYQRAAVSARTFLAGSPYHRMTPEEYDLLNPFSRSIIGMLEEKQKMASKALDIVLRDDPVVAVSLDTITRLDSGKS